MRHDSKLRLTVMYFYNKENFDILLVLIDLNAVERLVNKKNLHLCTCE